MQPRLFERFADRRNETWTSGSVTERLRGRLRGEGRIARALGSSDEVETPQAQVAFPDGWPTPESLLDQLELLTTPANGPVAAWAEKTLVAIEVALDTAGPTDAAAAGPLLSLGDSVATGMMVADSGSSPQLASQTRRAALAVARRVAVWRAAAAWCAAEDRVPDSTTSGDVAVMLGAQPIDPEVSRLLGFIERYESSG